MNQGKQKLLLGVLAVVALGAGSYYFVLREGEAPAPVVDAANAAGPKSRERPKNETKERAKRDRDAVNAAKTSAPVEVASRARPEDEPNTAAKSRPKAATKAKKKVERTPAS